MPMRMPVVNGICSLPASAIVLSRRAGTLSGARSCAMPGASSRSETRLEHEPHAHVHLAQRGEIALAHHARG